MISQERMEKALTFLAESDEEFAIAKSQVSIIKHKMKVAEAVGFLAADGTAGERAATSIVSKSYLDLAEGYYDAILTDNTIGTKRFTEEKVFEAWRSLNSARKAGMIT